MQARMTQMKTLLMTFSYIYARYTIKGLNHEINIFLKTDNVFKSIPTKNTHIKPALKDVT
jgi:hypothetical protein